jgi:hypothetical protein
VYFADYILLNSLYQLQELGHRTVEVAQLIPFLTHLKALAPRLVKLEQLNIPRVVLLLGEMERGRSRVDHRRRRRRRRRHSVGRAQELGEKENASRAVESHKHKKTDTQIDRQTDRQTL